MIQKLRQILLTQYIGAIVTAIVAAHCVQTFTVLVISILWHWVIEWRTPAGVFGESHTQGFDWNMAIYHLVDVLLNGAVVYSLMRWLYFGHNASAVPDGEGSELPAPEPTERSS
ncbi:MAG: hypothetical protein WAO35_13815 [Terriglobia bacterium]